MNPSFSTFAWSLTLAGYHSFFKTSEGLTLHATPLTFRSQAGNGVIPETDMKYVALISIVSLLCLGCTEPTPHYNRLSAASFMKPLEKREYGTVKVFQTDEDISKPYETIGMLSCEGSPGEEAGIIKAMLYRAADMGGDGILLNPKRASGERVSSGNQVNVRFGWAALIDDGDQRAYRAHVIKFSD